MKERKTPEEMLEDFHPDYIDKNDGYGYYGLGQVCDLAKLYADQEHEKVRQEGKKEGYEECEKDFEDRVYNS